jgi:hypothetical protein
MLADPPSQYSPVFNAAYFSSDNIESDFATLDGDNNFTGTNTFNGTIALNPTGLNIAGVKLRLRVPEAAIEMYDNVNGLIYQLKFQSLTGNGTELITGTNYPESKTIMVNGVIKQQLSQTAVNLYDLHDQKHINNTLYPNQLTSGTWVTPDGTQTINYRNYASATTLPTYIAYNGNTSGCVYIPNPSNVALGTTLKLLSLTTAANAIFYVSLNGGRTLNNLANQVNVIMFANSAWPTVPTTYQKRNNISLGPGQSVILVVTLSLNGAGRFWCRFNG